MSDNKFQENDPGANITAKGFPPYRDLGDYYTKNRARARLIFWFLLSMLFATIAFYIAFHLWILDCEDGSWCVVESTSDWQYRALDWLLWSLAGTIVYLMVDFARFFPLIGKEIKIEESGNEIDPYPASFIEYSPWYISTLLKGPIIALVIMFFLDAATLIITDPAATGNAGNANQVDPAFSFNFKNLSHRVTSVIAFVLGFYSRVARDVLDGIMKTLFSKAWAEAHDEFWITSTDKDVILGESTSFHTDPLTDVIWAASRGTIDAYGSYTAPIESNFCGQEAVITAVSKASPKISKATKIKFIPFRIEGPLEAERGKTHKYRVSTKDTVAWSVNPETNSDINSDTGEYTAPAKDQLASDTVTITATGEAGQEKASCSNSLDIKLV